MFSYFDKVFFLWFQPPKTVVVPVFFLKVDIRRIIPLLRMAWCCRASALMPMLQPGLLALPSLPSLPCHAGSVSKESQVRPFCNNKSTKKQKNIKMFVDVVIML